MQGRFKRDGSAPAEPEPNGATDRGAAAPHAPQQGLSTGGHEEQGAEGEAARDKGDKPGKTGKAEKKPKGKTKAGPSGPGSRIALRNWRISTRLVSLLVLPVAAATTLGGIRISDSLDDIQQLDNMKLLTDMTKQATELAAALQDERDQSAGPLSHKVKATDYSVASWRQKTDRQVATFLKNTKDITGNNELNGVRSNLDAITKRVAQLKAIRRDAYADDTSITQTVDAYSQLIDQLLGLSQEMAQATSNPDMVQRTRALAAFSSAKEYASIQRAVLAAALPPNKTQFGKLSETDRRYALNALSNEDDEINQFKEIYGSYAGDPEDLLKPIDPDEQPTIKSARDFAQGSLSTQGGMKLRAKRSYRDWTDAASEEINQMKTIELTLLGQMEQKARELRQSAERDAIINGALIVLVLGVSLVGAFVVSRSMIRSLRRLQDTATKVAQERLPELVGQLSESDPQDVDLSVESVGVHSRDEIGRVATAFDDVHREAVRLAAEQAMLRGNVNAMFTNLSRRSQGLIQRQLSLISELESREADPDQLSSLFKLDHLATRMRRNGENLLVLAGEEPGRRWTRPVPLVDVLRAAASEVEQYERIELSAVPSTEVAGRVVNDLVHLLAELLENATSFSSPQTKVKVTGHALPDGRVLVEIHDTGIGLSPEDLAAINERLAAPPTVDVSVSRRMGLFVVGRLSQRHGIRIQLRPSDSGGTTALVMLPVDVAQGGRKVPGKPGGPGGQGGPAAAQAAAGAAAARRAPAGSLGGGQGGPGQGGPGQGGPGQGAPGGNRLGAGPERGQAGLGGSSRAALPARGNAPQSPAGRDAFPPVGGGQQQGPGNFFGDTRQGPPQGGARPVSPQDNGQDAFGGGRTAPIPPQRRAPQGEGQDGRPQLPPRGGPRAELPGGTPQPQRPAPADRQQPPAPWEPQAPDAPRGHDEPRGPRQGFAPPRDDNALASTAQFPAIAPDAQAPEGAGGYEAPGGPGATGTFPAVGPAGARGPQGGYGAEDTGAWARPQEGYAPGGQGQDGGYPPHQDQPREPRLPQRDARQDQGQNQGRGAPDRQDQQGYGYDDARQQGGWSPQDTGQFPAPGGPVSPYGQTDGYDTGQYPAPTETGQFPVPPQQGQYQGDPGSYQGASGTGQFPAPPQQSGPYQDPARTGQFPAPGQSGQFPVSPYPGQGRPGAYDEGPNAQPPAPRQPGAQGPQGTGGFAVSETSSFPVNTGYEPPRAPRPEGPPARELPRRGPAENALPPAGPGDGRTPLYDTLETSWFRGPQPAGQEQQPEPPRAAEPPRPTGPQRPDDGLLPAAPEGASDTPGRGPGPLPAQTGQDAWRASPNDELVRQAERVRQPSAGGVTTSGLPRRVPRANLVPGTAQQQPQQPTGPQVSRAPDDVRGRLTNLRRGIQQGRYQAGNSLRPSGENRPNEGYPRPSHQQER
ncbi:nitrate- and nitrite sensing domain-containing protein [Streptomyces sp. NRRL F-5630]|uniref:sensor histidine kinase n=1 Tax=Streptomyces sp. NRRL F-5630 TaxID=1463864 RepID=UPI0004C82B91|nr:nitrate- and nitrite sensing domain-containing protein [Streptomyces sp. NRRL F-5630]